MCTATSIFSPSRNASISWKAPLQALPPYVGNPLADLLEIRTICESVLQETFPAAVVNIEGDKSVCISGGSLRRKVDVVPAGWVDTAEYRQCFDVIYRGVRILDKGAGSTIRISLSCTTLD